MSEEKHGSGHGHGHGRGHGHDAKDRRTAKAAVITVSDTRTAADDEGGALVAELLAGAGHEVVRRRIVRDDRAVIASAVVDACEEGLDLVVTTGGTGIAPRDVTYEAIESILDKRLDGFGEAFRARSWAQVGARSVLSRAIAGTRGKALVAALPGSPKAVRLALEEVLLPIVPHAIGLLRG
jgi:molybdenum cofactor biosynthesis protein B